MPSGPGTRQRRQRRRGTSSARGWGSWRHAGQRGRCSSSSSRRGWGPRGGKGEALQYLFRATPEWRQQHEAAKCLQSAVGSIVRLLRSQQAGGGPTQENVLPDYGGTMLAHDTVASRYPTETMVKAACTPHFSIPKLPARSGTGSSGSQASLAPL